MKNRIAELEQELAEKDKELQRYRTQVTQVNTRLEQILAQVAHEVEMAGAIQKLLTPTQLPNITGFDFSTKYVSGMKSGGDYFDIFEHEDRMKFGIVIASSSGYAMSSLFLSVLIKISTQVEAKRGLEPHQMIETLAKELVPQIKNTDRASVFYAVVDKRNYELSYCSAGQIEAYLKVYGKEALEHLEASTAAISKDFNAKPQSLKLSLNPRDRLIIATEGLVKATNGQSQTWGGEALREAIRSAPQSGVHELRNEILYRNEKFSGKSDPDRDQTVVVMEVKDRVIKLARQ